MAKEMYIINHIGCRKVVFDGRMNGEGQGPAACPKMALALAQEGGGEAAHSVGEIGSAVVMFR
jgi:hypothetical protein